MEFGKIKISFLIIPKQYTLFLWEHIYVGKGIKKYLERSTPN